MLGVWGKSSLNISRGYIFFALTGQFIKKLLQETETQNAINSNYGFNNYIFMCGYIFRKLKEIAFKYVYNTSLKCQMMLY